MNVRSNAANNALLNYAINTNPDPLQVSPADGTLTIVVSNGGTSAIYCNSITFSFDIGPNAQDLTAVSSGILYSASPSDQWQIAEQSAGIFVATPTKPEYNEITSKGLSFQIYNIKVNDQVGTFSLTVQENSSTDNETFSNHTNTYQIAKFPYGFYVGNFAASAPQVTDGSSVTLTWDGSEGADYTILYGQSSIDVTDVRTWTSQALHQDTTFFLKASVHSQDETVDNYLSITVNVGSPDLNASTLTVSGLSTLKGNTAVGSTLNVNGSSTLNGVTVNNDLNANNNVNIRGNARVSGTTSLNAINVNGPVRSLNYGKSINPGTYQATTDGFIVGSIRAPQVQPNIKCLGYIWASSGSGYVDATGGTFACYVWDNGWMGANSGNLLLPVSAGSSWAVGVQLFPNWNQIDPVYHFSWVPFGTGVTYEESFVKLSDEVTLDIPPSPPAPSLISAIINS
ncbi:hypothetical protein [Paenibacillus alginolyticus]|uniref:Uncharacterized protein n=1 Tax=Paenibacillus alginolyticus TaxID=59839 RepID=A0ABT4GE58_9BACL|nr:hypothetical protein [Paenibacillus alginolyticus]MCY9694353.1 hypothetical protein [Paenibacillus alginolyticus]MEC0147522.1 hypothetical protein [Paenibacillus alginolyticus]